MTRVVAALEQMGYVSRLSDPGDRRRSRVDLTAKGRTVLRQSRSRKTAYLASQLLLLPAADRRALPDLTGLLERLVSLEDRERAAGCRAPDLPFAAHPQLPALLHRPAHLGLGHLDAVGGPGVAGAAPRGTGVDLGIVVGLQFLPMLLFGPFGGLTADRVDKRKLLFLTQSSGGLLALVLGLLVVSHHVQLWQVYVLATLLGGVNLFDNPARQTFMMEMVGRDDLPNAVSLNSVVMNASRVIGPAIGGLIITLFGLGICFLVNAASYVAVVIGLSMMRTSELHPTERASGSGARSARGSATSGVPRSPTRCSPSR